MTTEAEQLANDLVGGYSEPTRLESAAAALLRSQAAEIESLRQQVTVQHHVLMRKDAEIERLKAEANTCGSGAGCCAQAAEIERLKAELGDLPEAQAELLSACKRKDALIRRAWSVIRWQCFGECRTPGVAGLPTAAEVDDEIKTELGE